MTLSEASPVFDPFVPYSEENYPPLETQNRFFHCALLEADTIEDPARTLRGPLYGGISAMLSELHTTLRAGFPHATAEWVMPVGYQSTETIRTIENMSSQQRAALEDIRNLRTRLTKHFADTHSRPLISEQTIDNAILDVPPYCKQGDDPRTATSEKLCVNASFRMVFGAIAGWTPYESAVDEQMIRHRGRAVVHDVEYRKLFATDAFQTVCDKGVLCMEMTGADLASIAQIVLRLKQRNPEVRAYCIVSLGSAVADFNAWHSNVLLSATGDTVICHDPSETDGGPSQELGKEAFINRWAIAHNRAQLIVAD